MAVAIEAVREYFRQFGIEDRIREFEVSSATVELAAQAVGVQPARIAKTLSFRVDGGAVLIVAAGDAKIDNAKFKAQYHQKATMLSPDEVVGLVGHAVGGDKGTGRKGRGKTGIKENRCRKVSQPIAVPAAVNTANAYLACRWCRV